MYSHTHGATLALLATLTCACATSHVSSLHGTTAVGSALTVSTGLAHAERSQSPERSARADVEALAHVPVLEREAYVRAVLKANPSLEAARQGLRAALARVRQAGTFQDPMLEVAVAPLSIGSSNAPFGYDVSLSQELPWFGKRGLERDMRSAEAEAARSDLATTQRELALAALVLYDQYYLTARSLEINAHHVALMRVIQASATAQFEAGRGSAQDPLQAEVELSHMEHDAALLAAQRDVVAAQMNELLHREPEAPLPPPPAELVLRALPDVHAAKRLESEAVRQRAEIASLRQRARAEQARAEQAERERYPNFRVFTGYSSMWEMPQHRFTVGVGLNLPLGFERRAGAVEEATAARAEFESRAARMTDSVRSETYVALRRLGESEHVLALFERRLLPAARDQIDAARAGFIASQNPFLAVVEAERNLRGVELDYQTARADCDRRHGELDRALGRIPGLDATEGEP